MSSSKYILKDLFVSLCVLLQSLELFTRFSTRLLQAKRSRGRILTEIFLFSMEFRLKFLSHRESVRGTRWTKNEKTPTALFFCLLLLLVPSSQFPTYIRRARTHRDDARYLEDISADIFLSRNYFLTLSTLLPLTQSVV